MSTLLKLDKYYDEVYKRCEEISKCGFEVWAEIDEDKVVKVTIKRRRR